MLSDSYTPDDIRTMLVPREMWRPYPTVSDRPAWQALPEATRRYYLAQGEAALGFEWPALPATLFLEYARVGNRARYQSVCSVRRRTLRDLVLAECLEGEGRFLDDIVNGIWTTCEETYWGYPAHVGVQAAGVDLPDVMEPTVDLFAAETAAQLAWTVTLLGARLDQVSPLVGQRVRYEAKRRVLDPCLERDDFWWMGFEPAGHGVNNWNPWVNSNWLTTTLLLEEDEDRRVAAVHKILRSLDIFLGVYAEAGGCDEGPGYWGRAAASLFDGLDLLHKATDGGIDIFDAPKIRNMGSYIYRVHIHDDYYVNFADASAINRPPGSLVFRYGQAVGDEEMQAFGAWLMTEQTGERGKQEGSLGRMLPAFFEVPDLLGVEPVQPLPRDAWFDGIEVMVARDQAGTPQGFFVAAKGGHNAESHNHNDVGNVIVYVDGRPLIVDAGVETYRRKTFSPERYEIWTMQSAYHTLLPTIDATEHTGLMQAPGEGFAARGVTYRADDAKTEFALDLSGAYPPEANLQAWGRTVTLERAKAVVVEDAFTFVKPVAAVSLSLLTPCEVELEDGAVYLTATTFGPRGMERETGSGQLRYEVGIFDVAVERIEIDDPRLAGVWGDHLYRVVFTAQSPPLRGRWLWRLRNTG
ncbi:MAG: heparinase II/III domain-containing protein [Anaerolineae bacterium]